MSPDFFVTYLPGQSFYESAFYSVNMSFPEGLPSMRLDFDHFLEPDTRENDSQMKALLKEV
jgi:hypothetical protein